MISDTNVYSSLDYSMIIADYHQIDTGEPKVAVVAVVVE